MDSILLQLSWGQLAIAVQALACYRYGMQSRAIIAVNTHILSYSNYFTILYLKFVNKIKEFILLQINSFNNYLLTLFTSNVSFNANILSTMHTINASLLSGIFLNVSGHICVFIIFCISSFTLHIALALILAVNG